MAAPKMTSTFNAFWPFLKDQARRRDLTPSSWMEAAGLSRQRYYDFEKGVDISARSFIKLCGGVRMTVARAASESGIHFVDAQEADLQFEAKVDAKRTLLEKLLDDPEKMALLEKEYEL